MLFIKFVLIRLRILKKEVSKHFQNRNKSAKRSRIVIRLKISTAINRFIFVKYKPVHNLNLLGSYQLDKLSTG